MTKVLSQEEIQQFFSPDEIARYDTDETVQDKLRNLENQKEDWIKDIFLNIDQNNKDYYEL